MPTINRVSLYKEAFSLEGQRAALQTKLDKIVGRLGVIKSELFSEQPSSSKTSKAPTKNIAAKKKTRAGRGELKAAVLNAMKAAGDTGVKVGELAKRLGVKPPNMYAWFQQAVKRMPEIKKIGTAHYSLGKAAMKSKASPRKKSKRRSKSARVAKAPDSPAL